MTYHPRARFIETVKDRIRRRQGQHAARTFIAIEPNGRRRADLAATTEFHARRIVGRKFMRTDPAEGWIEAQRYGWRVERIDNPARRKIRIVAAVSPGSPGGGNERGEGAGRRQLHSPRSPPIPADEAAP